MASTAERSTAPFDAIAADLQLLRSRAGDVTYAEIAARIARHREERGMSEAAARVARSTVFDAFRSGRRRVNAELVAEIVIALGESEEAADRWRQRCLEARAGAEVAYDEGGSSPQPDQHRAMRTALTIAVLAACVGLNIFGNTVAAKFGLPLFLDMIGTAAAAFAFGPWAGALVAVATNLSVTVAGDPISYLFALVSITGALVWGYGFHRVQASRTWAGFLSLNVIAGIACTMVAVPITVLLLGGNVSHATGSLAESLGSLGYSLWAAVFSVNLLASIADKVLSGCLALLLVRFLIPPGIGSGLPDTRGPLLRAPASRWRARRGSVEAENAGKEAAHSQSYDSR